MANLDNFRIEEAYKLKVLGENSVAPHRPCPKCNKVDCPCANAENNEENCECGGAPGGANFQGASKVVHPVMAEACVDFAARAIKELFPPDGPTRTKILGDIDDEKVAVAERKRDYMNWQLTEQIEEFCDEQEQMLTQLPLGGSQYLKIWYDEKKRRPCAQFLPIDNVLLPFATANFYTSPRVTEVDDISDWEFKSRIRSGLYRDTDFVRATMDPEPTGPQKATDKIEGRSPNDNEDGLRRVYHIYTWLEVENDPYTKVS